MDSGESGEGGLSRPQVIVVGNEKGGAGKSTIAIHIAVALLHADAKVAMLDLDLRQQSTSHFFANRQAWTAATAPPCRRDPLCDSDEEAELDDAIEDAPAAAWISC